MSVSVVSSMQGITGPTAVYVLYGAILGAIMLLGLWLLFWAIDEWRDK